MVYKINKKMQYLILSDKLASSKRTNTLEDFSKKLLSNIYMYISYIPEFVKLSDRLDEKVELN